MKYKKRPIVVEATQWFRNGDHPEDGEEVFAGGPFRGEKYEGKVVRYYRHPNVPGTDFCAYCKRMFHDHGWIDTLEGGHIVCPGDWVIKGIKGEFYSCKPDIFKATYEEVSGSDELAGKIIRHVHPKSTDGPMWEWFGLTYSAYLVLHRVALCSMPIEWQGRFIAMLDEIRKCFGDCQPEGTDGFWVRLKDSRGRFVRDPLSGYRHHPVLKCTRSEGGNS